MLLSSYIKRRQSQSDACVNIAITISIPMKCIRGNKHICIFLITVSTIEINANLLIKQNRVAFFNRH